MLPNTLEGEARRRVLRKNYGEYCKHVNAGFCLTKFHKYLCDSVQEFIETPTDKIFDILLLSVPPRHGKSATVTETLPSWYLGKYPRNEVIICGYESTFAEGFSRRNRDKFNEYASDIFRVDSNKNVQGVAMWETAEGGRCHAAGLKAGITGYGADLFIIDDPIKNQESAESETILGRIHNEMGPSVQSRIHPHGKLIVIQTRWVENDVIGYIEANWSENIWRNINLPFECEDEEHDPLGRHVGDSLMGPHLGDPVLPDRISNDNASMLNRKRIVMANEGEHVWNALYQGHPSAANGNLFKREHWKLYEREGVDVFDYLCLSVDATFKQTDTSDMVAIEMWGLRRNKIYLYRLINKRMGFVETLALIKTFCAEYPQIDELVIEDKANGSAIIDSLRYSEGIPPVVAVNPQGGKYSRAQAIAPLVASGICYLPSDLSLSEMNDIVWDGEKHITGIYRFIEQMAQFPFSKHDDMVDSCSQALSRLHKLLTGEIQAPVRRFIRYTKWYPDMWEDYYRMSPSQQEEFIRIYGAPEEWREEGA